VDAGEVLRMHSVNTAAEVPSHLPTREVVDFHSGNDLHKIASLYRVSTKVSVTKITPKGDWGLS